MPEPDWSGFYAGASAVQSSFGDAGGLTADGTGGSGSQAGDLRALGRRVVGGELAHVRGRYDVFPDLERRSTRLLPYGFFGISRDTIDPVNPNADSVAIQRLGVKFPAMPAIAVGAAYLAEDKTAYDNDFDVEASEVSVRRIYWLSRLADVDRRSRPPSGLWPPACVETNRVPVVSGRRGFGA